MRDHSGKRILSAATDNWPSRCYLAVCAGLLIWTALETTVAGGADASFAGVWPLAATLPTSLAVLPLLSAGLDSLGSAQLGALLFLLAVAVAALVNATLLGLVVRALRRRTTPRT